MARNTMVATIGFPGREDQPDMPGTKGASPHRATSTSRLASLIFYLDEHPGGATAAQIRSEVAGYGRSQGNDAFDRQFRRDRKTLDGMGFHVARSDDPVPTYRLDLSQTMQDDAGLDLEDAYLLADCAGIALQDPDFPFTDELASAMSKLGDCIGRAARPAGPGASGSAVGDGRGRQDLGAVSTAIEQAFGEQGMLSFRYRGAGGSMTSRHTVPLETFRYLGDSYLLAYDVDRGDSRRFRLDRIDGTPTVEDAPSRVLDAAASHASDAPAVLPFQIGCGSFEAKVYFSASTSMRAARLTCGYGKLVDHGNGKLWTVDAADEGELAGWAVENGPGILLVEPEGAVRKMRTGLERVVEASSNPMRTGTCPGSEPAGPETPGAGPGNLPAMDPSPEPAGPDCIMPTDPAPADGMRPGPGQADGMGI